MGIKTQRVRVGGKFFRLGGSKWILRAFSYGPFSPNLDCEFLPDEDQVHRDLARMLALGANGVRVYYPPPLWFLDAAENFGLRVLVDVPWEKHRCWFEDWDACQRAREIVAQTAKNAGQHPACLAISVANEFPNDVVRFYGQNRVGKFVDELLDSVRQNAPECLATFVNFPTTEFLTATQVDFHCFNVYLNEPERLSAYLNRLQHIAGDLPLVLSEFGFDSHRLGELQQQNALSSHLTQIARQGLAGSVLFSFTDDWFTGGQRVDDWKFGVTDCDRVEKPSAATVRRAWALTQTQLLGCSHMEIAAAPNVPATDVADCDQPSLATPAATNSNVVRAVDNPFFPSVSVVVCCYNGGQTLAECLQSLMHLKYPNYEVILVDDGSTDDTQQITARFPSVKCISQTNRGLSAARNAGAEAATGEIIAYTDADCVADEDWLTYLVRPLRDPTVAIVGGPNITPPGDGWVSKCVAASPGNPCHVMLDDHFAEHVPGCNLACRRNVFLGLGGFDPQFRQAGDDVDYCWRVLDAGLHISYAPSAMVWHHRRANLREFLRQQRGYGWAEALVQLKHPRRCNSLGRFHWNGIIYGCRASLPGLNSLIYHGRFGGALFQSIYHTGATSLFASTLSLEWHLLMLFVMALGLLSASLLVVALLMLVTSLAVAILAARQPMLPRGAPWWGRPLIGYLHIAQPIARSARRYKSLWRNARLPCVQSDPGTRAQREPRSDEMSPD